MKKERSIIDKSFKENAVKLSYERSSISELAKELGTTSQSIYRWRKEFAKYGENSFPGNGNPKQTAEEKEIADLKKKLAQLELEHEILKKAVHIFSRDAK